MLRKVYDWIYWSVIWAAWPINWVLAQFLKSRFERQSVLHISNMVHIPYQTVQILRRLGMKADYLALGTSPVWNKSDFQVTFSKLPMVRAVQEMWWFWTRVIRYEVIHCHFMLTISRSGWEYPFLKRMGRKIVIHFRGCDARYRDLNLKISPKWNICDECDYDRACMKPVTVMRRNLAMKYGDGYVVTTPDLLDFAPKGALYLPFFSPEYLPSPATAKRKQEGDLFRIVHATNHPGIEGTRYIQSAIERLKARGYPIEFLFLKGVSPQEVEAAYRKADLAIGKMKMGHYANSQIESMVLEIPTITYVRPEFMTPELKDSGFIFSSLDKLEKTIEHYITHPEELEQKRKIARASVLKLHDNERIGSELIHFYQELKVAQA